MLMRKAYTTSRFDRRLVIFLKSHPDLSEHIKVTLDRIISNPFDKEKGLTRMSAPNKRKIFC